MGGQPDHSTRLNDEFGWKTPIWKEAEEETEKGGIQLPQCVHAQQFI